MFLLLPIIVIIVLGSIANKDKGPIMVAPESRYESYITIYCSNVSIWNNIDDNYIYLKQRQNICSKATDYSNEANAAFCQQYITQTLTLSHIDLPCLIY